MARSRINQARRVLRLTERTLGDIQAVQRGRIGQRLANRIMGRAVSRLTRGLWR